MLTSVSVRNRLGKNHNINIRNTSTGGVSCLPVLKGVASIAAQIILTGREAILAEGQGFEIVFSKNDGVPVLSLHRRTALGALRVASLRVHKHSLLYTHTAHDYEVFGLERLGTHLVCRSHAFENTACRPLSILSRAMLDLQLQFAKSTPVNMAKLQNLGNVMPKCHNCGNVMMFTVQTTEPGICCSTNSKLLTPGSTSAHADNHCLAGDCESCQDENNKCICCGFDFNESQQHIPHFSTHSCCGMEKYKALYMFNSNLISRLSSICPELGVENARGLCLNLVLAHGMRVDKAGVLLVETLQEATIAPEALQRIQAVLSDKPCTTLQYRDVLGEKKTVMVYQGPADICAFVVFSAHGSPMLVGAVDPTPVRGARLPFTKLREAVGEMMFLHKESTDDPTLRSCRHSLKIACYEKYANNLEPESRSILYALCNEGSPGFYGLASEMVYNENSCI